MPDITDPDEPTGSTPSRWRRVGWFVFLYLASLGAVGALAYGLRALLSLG